MESQNKLVLQRIEKNLKTLEPNKKFYVKENKIWKISGSAFTIDKTYIFLCMNNPDYNTLMYVACHELAHILSSEWGHGKEFSKNFRDIVHSAIQLGMYTYVDYRQKPVDYCGFKLNSQVI